MHIFQLFMTSRSKSDNFKNKKISFKLLLYSSVMFLACKVLGLFFARKMLFKASELKGFNFLALCWLLIFLPFISLNIHGLWSNHMSQFNLGHLQSIYHVYSQAAALHVLLQRSLRCKVKDLYHLKINQSLCGAWGKGFWGALHRTDPHRFCFAVLRGSGSQFSSGTTKNKTPTLTTPGSHPLHATHLTHLPSHPPLYNK